MVGRTNESGQELWLLDTTTSTYEPIDIAPGEFGSIGDAFSLPFAYKDSLLVVAAENAQQGDELWALRLDDSERQAGDVNEDGAVGFADFLVLSQNFGKQSDAVWAEGDFDGDGIVGFADFLLLSENFGV